MTLQQRTTPRPHLLHRASTAGRPLIIALPGYSQEISPPPYKRRWFDLQWRANFVEESGLLELAERRDLNVCFIASARYAFAPWWSRNWSAKDVIDIDIICGELWYKCRPSKTFLWGFSDGATLVHLLATDTRASHVFHAAVAYSGLWPSSAEFWKHCPCLLVIGDQEPHRSIRDAQPEIQARYRDAGRVCELWELPGVRHEWSAKNNERFLAWCVSHS